MVAWVVISRQHLPRAARGPSQPRKSRPIRALPLAARLFNNPTFKPANDPQFPPASIPILKLTPPSSHRKSPPSFHTLTWNPFCNPFVFIFMHVMGGTRVCVGTRFLFVATTTYCERVVGRAQFVATTCSCHTDSYPPMPHATHLDPKTGKGAEFAAIRRTMLQPDSQYFLAAIICLGN